MIVNVTQKLNLHAKRTKRGEDHNVFPRNGFAMVILIALMEQTRTQHYTTVQHLSLVLMINSLAKTAVASTKDGLAITTTIVVMDRMKESSVTLNTRPARPKSLLVKTSNVSEINIDAMEKTTAEIIRMRLDVRKITTRARLVNLLVTTGNALTIISFVTKSPIVLMTLTSRFIATLMSAQKLKSTSADTNALIR